MQHWTPQQSDVPHALVNVGLVLSTFKLMQTISALYSEVLNASQQKQSKDSTRMA